MYNEVGIYQMHPIGSGEAIRIYKNVAGDTIGLDEINIAFYGAQRRNLTPTAHDNTFIVQPKMSCKRTLLYPGAAVARVIDSIEFIGDFNCCTEGMGNFLDATWEFDILGDGSVNDCMVGFVDYPVIGDTI